MIIMGMVLDFSLEILVKIPFRASPKTAIAAILNTKCHGNDGNGVEYAYKWSAFRTKETHLSCMIVTHWKSNMANALREIQWKIVENCSRNFSSSFIGFLFKDRLCARSVFCYSTDVFLSRFQPVKYFIRIMFVLEASSRLLLRKEVG